jgi:SNF2 family DNA or RNA helicase
LQFSSGAVYTDEHKNWKEVHTVKLDALADLIEQNEGECILVAYNFKTDLERLQQRFPKAQVLDQNPNTVTRWNNGEIPILLAHPASSSHGLNLQHGGTMIVWFCLSWSLEYYQQFNGRLHRQGQSKPVRIIHIVARDTIDERIVLVLNEKGITQDALLKALKHIDK